MNNSKSVVNTITTTGPVVGKLCTSIYGDDYISFERIPYAQSPLGVLRFKAPVPVTPWKDPLMCCQTGEKPLQYNHYTKELQGVENCLYVNVYIKTFTSEEPLPIIVFFFGGGFEKGDPTRELHSPDYFMMQNVVVITVSYRVGPLGFLSLKDPAAGVPGNAGLKDQLLAMTWIAQNAAAFNGDANNITAYGESAGAASVHYHMLNPNAEGLFHKAILQSGTVLCCWAQCVVDDLPHRLAKHLGMNEANLDSDMKVLQFLQKVPAEQLVTPYLLSEAENLDDCVFQFGPVVEPYVSNGCVIPKEPSDLFKNAWGNKIPVLMSGTSFEGLLMYARVHISPYLLTSLKDQPEYLLPRDLKRKVSETMAQTLGKRIHYLHFGGKPVEFNSSSIKSYCEYASYKIFWHPILRTLKSRIKSSAAPTYLYRFDFDSPTFNHQRLKYCGDQMRGVAHVDDHSYIWYGDFSWKLDKDTPEFQTIQRMIDIITTFAATSDPNCDSVNVNLPRGIQWQPVVKKNIKCLNISHNLQVVELPELDKLKTWTSLYKSKSKLKFITTSS